MSITPADLPPCKLVGVDRFRSEALHAPIEAVKKSVYHSESNVFESRPLRSVRIVYRQTTSRELSGRAILQRLHIGPSLHHWALQIENSSAYFELRLDKVDQRRAIFVHREWQEHHLQAVKLDRVECGYTIMNDDELIAIGAHLLHCWATEYSKLDNNCQLLLNEILHHVLLLPTDNWNRSVVESYLYHSLDLHPGLLLLRMTRIVPRHKQEQILREYYRRVLPHSRYMGTEGRHIYRSLEDDLSSDRATIETLSSAWVDYCKLWATGAKKGHEDLAGTIFRKSRLDKVWIAPTAYVAAPFFATAEVGRNLAMIGGKRLYAAGKQVRKPRQQPEDAQHLPLSTESSRDAVVGQESGNGVEVYKGYNMISLAEITRHGFSMDTVVDQLEKWEVEPGGGAEFTFGEEDMSTVVEALRQRCFGD